MNFTKSQLEKLGNTMTILAKNVGELSMTKALKLLFLIEENSIKKYGVPFFGFIYQVWQYGPVVEPIYDELHPAQPNLLSPYIKKLDFVDEFVAIAEFNDDEFSDNDIAVLEEIINFARHKTAGDLVKYTHGEGSMWRKSAEEHGILQAFKNGELKRTAIELDFMQIINEDALLRSRYESYLDYQQFNNFLNV